MKSSRITLWLSQSDHGS